MARSADFKTPPCRFSYVHNMFTPVKKTNDAGQPILGKDGKQVVAWECTLIFPKSTDRKPFDDALKTVIVEEWGEGGLAKAKAGLIRTPYLDGMSKEAHNKKTGELHPGMGADVWFIRVSTRIEPPIRYLSEIVPATSADIKSGDYGFAVLNAYTWTNSKNGDGVSFGIQYLQKKTNGEQLGNSGGVDVGTYYEAVEDAGDAPASVQEGKGAAGFFG